jgi:transposase
MTVRGVGALTALAFRTAVDEPERFASSAAVGAYFGLTPSKYASGETDYTGHITKCGDKAVRVLLCEAANALLTRVSRWSWVKRWGLDESAGHLAGGGVAALHDVGVAALLEVRIEDRVAGRVPAPPAKRMETAAAGPGFSSQHPHQIV